MCIKGALAFGMDPSQSLADVNAVFWDDKQLV